MKSSKIACGEKGCKGVPFSIPTSRLELSLGHVKYQCDTCSAQTKRVFALRPPGPSGGHTA